MLTGTGMETALLLIAAAGAGRVVLAIPRATHRVARLGFGAFYVACGLFNLLVVIPDAAAVYATFAGLAWLPATAWLVQEVLAPTGTVFLGIVALGELAIGALLLVRDDAAGRFGLALATALVLGLALVVPWPAALLNIAIAAAQVRLLVALGARQHAPSRRLPGPRAASAT